MKKDNTITVFYDEATRKDIYRLNGVDVTDTIEMLKDKWERQILDTRCRLFQLDMSIQQRLQDQLALTEKALELAVDYMFKELKLDGYQDIHWDGSDLTLLQENIDCFLEQAEEMMKDAQD